MVNNIIWSILGLGLPGITAAISIPRIIENLGYEIFGLLGLAWTITSVGGLFDLGVGRSIVYFLSPELSQKNTDKIKSIFISAFQISILSGIFISILFQFVVFLGVYKLFSVEKINEIDIFNMLLTLSFIIPVQTISACFRGTNEALGNFARISFARTLNGIIVFGGPVIISLISNDIILLIIPLLLGRILVCLFLFFTLRGNFQRLGVKWTKFDIMLERKPEQLRNILRFGMWTSVSSFLSPVMVQGDRFFIAISISISSLGLYTVAQEAVGQTLILIGAITTVLFPKFSQDRTDFHLFRRVSIFIIPILFVLYFILFLSFPLFFQLIIPDVDKKIIIITNVLLIGAFFNSIGGVPFSFIQANGRADITAKIHLIELPIYILLLYFCVSYFGLLGAAYAWSLRMCMDSILLWAWSIRNLR